MWPFGKNMRDRLELRFRMHAGRRCFKCIHAFLVNAIKTYRSGYLISCTWRVSRRLESQI